MTSSEVPTYRHTVHIVYSLCQASTGGPDAQKVCHHELLPTLLPLAANPHAVFVAVFVTAEGDVVDGCGKAQRPLTLTPLYLSKTAMMSWIAPSARPKLLVIAKLQWDVHVASPTRL
jgi:hypothetical protein